MENQPQDQQQIPQQQQVPIGQVPEQQQPQQYAQAYQQQQVPIVQVPQQQYAQPYPDQQNQIPMQQPQYVQPYLQQDQIPYTQPQYAQAYPDQQIPYPQPGGAQIIMQQPQMQTGADHIDTQLMAETSTQIQTDPSTLLRSDSKEMRWSWTSVECICQYCNEPIKTESNAECCISFTKVCGCFCFFFWVVFLFGLIPLCLLTCFFHKLPLDDPHVHRCPLCKRVLHICWN